MRQEIGRNDPCPCGSQKKYKKCCGKPGLQGRSVAVLQDKEALSAQLFKSNNTENSLVGRIVKVNNK